MDVMDRLDGSGYQALDREIKRTMRRSASDAVLLGHLLRKMYDGQLWMEEYDCLDEYLQRELHMDYSMATRFMNINKRYSVGGNSGEIADDWTGFSQSVLIEMLNMPPELAAMVTPDMTVRQVQEVKRQARREKGQAEDRAAPQTPETVEMEAATDGAAPAACGIPAEAPAQERDTLPERAEGGRGAEAFPAKDEVPDAEFRELEPAAEVATSQPERSAYGLEKTAYPEGSLLSAEGCGNMHDCFSCAQDCGMRQKDRYCRSAPLGSPFGCETMGSLEGIRAEMGGRCQFIDNSLAGHKAGNGEADPCCMDCPEECGHRCRRSRQVRDAAPQEDAAEDASGAEPDSGILDRLAETKRILEAERKTLDDYLEVAAKEAFPERLMFKQRTIVDALTEMLRGMDEAAEAEPGEKEQPPLPLLKNDGQRKAWLKSYKDWGLWYRDGNIGVDYYKFDFGNGARLVVEAYQEEATRYCGAYESSFLHLIGGQEAPMGQHGVGKWQMHRKYARHPNSETELVEFLKELQKRGDG